MSTSVGSIHYDLGLDTSKFDAASGRVSSKMDKFVGFAKTAAKAGAIAAAATGVVMLKTGADYNILQQKTRAALKTLLGSAEAANKQMDKLDTFAKTSPFAKDAFLKAQQQLLGFGLEADKVVPTLDAMQQTVAAIGGTDEDIEQLSATFSKILGTGRLTGEELVRFGEKGVNAAAIIAAEMGITEQAVRDMASKPGGIPADQVFDPLVNGLQTKFGGAADNVKSTMTGAIDRVKAAFRDLGSFLVKPFIDPEGGGLGVTAFNKLADVMRKTESFLRNDLPTAWNNFYQKIKPIIDFFNAQVLPALKQIFGWVGKQLVAAWNDLMVALEPHLPMIKQVAKIIGIGLAIALGIIIGLILGLVIMVGLIIAFFARLIGWIAKAISWFNSASASIRRFVFGALGTLYSAGVNLIRGLINGIRAMGGALWGGISRTLSGIGRFVSGIGSWLVNAGRSLISGLVRGIKQMASAPADAVRNVLNKARNLLPFSPAKEGPFSGKGYTLHSGMAIMKDFARGIQRNATLPQDALNNALSGSLQASQINVQQQSGLNPTSTNIYGNVTIGSRQDADYFFDRMNRNQSLLGLGLAPEVGTV